VNLQVSKGPQPISVPSVVGMEENDAVDAIEAAGLKADVLNDEINDPKVPKGSVAVQSPASGTLTKGATVTLTISDGPKLVKVPSFVGKQAAEARKGLEALGFKVEVNNILGGFFGTVRDQDPVDEEVPEGSVITLTVV
jgi:serine/threonine-protein kinase